MDSYKHTDVDPYSYLHDTNNALKEYYKLKQQLCLTEEERYRLIANRLPDDIVKELIIYKCQNGLSLEELAAMIGIHRVSLSKILNGHHQPYNCTKEKIMKVLGG